MVGLDIVQQPVDREVVAGSDFLQQLDDLCSTGAFRDSGAGAGAGAGLGNF